MLDLLLTKLLPDSIEGIARHTEATPEAEAAALLKQLENGELRTIVSSNTFSRLGAFPFVKHVVFAISHQVKIFFSNGVNLLL